VLRPHLDTPHVKVGGRYKMEEGEIEVDSIEPIGIPDITPELARASGFLGIVDLLKVANHGRAAATFIWYGFITCDRVASAEEGEGIGRETATKASQLPEGLGDPPGRPRAGNRSGGYAVADCTRCST
jgi:hypothetical protein